MRRLVLSMICAASATPGAVQPSVPEALTSVLHRAGERVEHFFRRAQSLVCLEIVHLQLIGGRDDCVSVKVDGGSSGRLWIDGETFDVLRLDQRLNDWVDIPLPRTARRLVAKYPTSWTMERMDTSTRFRRVTFQNPEEAIVLPESSVSLRIMRGSETPRLRSTVEYRNYQRFLTGGRIVGD